jgi:DNA-binding NarL/FixJ family response regulator
MDMIRILLADDHAIVRQGLRALLSNVHDIEVVAEAEDGREALEKAERHKPDVIIMDFAMPGLNGLEGTRRIANHLPSAKVLVLTMHNNEEYILQCLKAGAAGYLLKDAIADELIEAVRTIMTHKRFISPSLSAETLEYYINRLDAGKLASPLESLTAREREVLQLIAEGHTNKKIASMLSISVKTVETHRAHLMDKLNIHDQAGLIRFAIQHGITPFPAQSADDANSD